MERYIIAHCSPTLAGLKTANLFSAPYETNKTHYQINAYNKILGSKGVNVRLLSCSGGRALIYVYRRKKLIGDLNIPLAKKSLQAMGYEVADADSALLTLSQKLDKSDEFPHEIGFFLGFPPEDTVGFIENCGKNYKCCGCWKVYFNEDTAEKTFAKYKKCTEVYRRCYIDGFNISKLCIKL